MPAHFSDLHAQLLDILRESGNDFVALPVLAQLTNSSIEQLNQLLAELDSLSCPLERESGTVRLAEADPLPAAEIDYRLDTEQLGRAIYHFAEIGSTNLKAAELAETGVPDGTLVLADRQLQGKGRLSHSWHSPAGVGIYLSLVLRPRIPVAAAPGISLVAALALVESIKNLYSQEAAIKWPNDILLNNRKLAGILTELTSDGDQVRHVILGLGINCNQTEFPAEISDLAISLRQAVGASMTRVHLLATWLSMFESRYRQLQDEGFESLLPEIKKHSAVLGKRIKFRAHSKSQTGVAVDIDPTGRLVVEAAGQRLKLSAGEVTLEDNY